MRKAKLAVALALAAVFLTATVATQDAAAIDCTNLKMLAKGTIVDADSETLQSNVWFSAYISTTNFNFTIGENIWNQAGFAMVWGTSGEPDSINGTQEYISLSHGYKLIIDRLYKEGQPVTFIDARLSTYEPFVPEITPPTPPPSDEPSNIAGPSNDLFLQAGLIFAAGVIIGLMIVIFRRRTR
jgi:hypothetical protein